MPQEEILGKSGENREKVDQCLKIWIIYQNEEVARPYLETISGICSNLKSKEGIDVEPILSEKRLKNAGKPIYEVIEEDLNRSHLAIALIVDDDRKASEAGNVWFEMGMWFGRQNREDLAIFLHEDASDKLISNIAGFPFHRYVIDKTLEENVAAHIRNGWKKYFNKATSTIDTPYPARSKIFDTFAPTANQLWLRDNDYYCTYRKENCDFREQSLEFTAELLRMGRVNWERLSIQIILSHLAVIFKTFSNSITNYEKLDELSKFAILEDTSIAILSNLNEFFKIGNELMSRKTLKYNEIWSSKTRLCQFLCQRLDAAANLEKDSKLDQIIHDSGKSYDKRMFSKQYINRLAKSTEGFIEWVDLFRSDYEKGEYNHSTSHGMAKLGRETGLWYSYCEKVSQILEVLGSAYFNSCKSKLKEKLSGINDPSQTQDNLKQAIDSLPHHNSESSGHFRIWAEKEVKI